MVRRTPNRPGRTVAAIRQTKGRFIGWRRFGSVRLRGLDDERLDRVEGSAWTLRQVAFHAAGTYYAEPRAPTTLTRLVT